MFTLKPLFDRYPDFLSCNEDSGGDSACLGTSAVIRMSFTLFLFHLFIILTILPRVTCSKAFHDGCWLFKFLLVLGLYVCVFFIPNSFYQVWAYIGRIASCLFLMLQVVMVILAAYMMNDALVGSYDSKNVHASRCSGIVLIFLTILFAGGTLTLFIFDFVWFNDCAVGIILPILAILFVVAFFLFSSFLRCRPDASIFTSSVVGLYSAYLMWSSLASMPDDSCNPFTTSTPNTISQIVIGMFFTFVALIAVAIMSGGDQKRKDGEKQMGDNAKQVLGEDEEEAKVDKAETI